MEWLRFLDESKNPPVPYKGRSPVLVGVRHFSFFNPKYFFQFLLLNFPYRQLDTILPNNADDIPPAIRYFNTAASCMPQFFGNSQKFKDIIIHEGHKSYYIDTIITYVNSLIDMNNLYRCQLLPLSNPIHPNTHNNAPTLSGNQQVLFTMFTDMLKQRDNFHHEIPCKSSDVDWRKFILVLGKPGTGKTFTIHQCIDYCRENNIPVCVGLPTGTLACTYREKFDDTVHCDTVHSLFLY